MPAADRLLTFWTWLRYDKVSAGSFDRQVGFTAGIALLIEDYPVALGKDQEHLLSSAMGQLCTVLPTRHSDRRNPECLSKYVLPESQQRPCQPYLHREIDSLFRHSVTHAIPKISIFQLNGKH
jgi:hypothetical protein